MLEQIILARQPILDANCQTIGYELLYRDSNGCPPGEFFDGTSATCEVLLNAYTGVFDKGNLRSLPAFMNLNEELLYQDLPSFAAENVVLEILSDVTMSAEAQQRIRQLSKKGFKIALDNFVWRDEYADILDAVDIIKIDVLQLKGKALFLTLEKLSPYNLTLLAEKVETLAEFHRFKKLGFQLFQGYFFAYPEQIEGKRISGSKLTMMELLSALSDAASNPDDLDVIISKDPRLAVRLLKIVNSATFSIQRSISTIEEAIVLLGIDELKRWALVVSLSGTLDVPDELCRELLIRAKMCELLAPEYGAESGLAFLTGILSGADSLFSIPLEELNRHIPVSDDILLALLHRKGDLELLLNDVIKFSRYEWNCLSGTCADTELVKAQAESIKWALDSQKAAA